MIIFVVLFCFFKFFTSFRMTMARFSLGRKDSGMLSDLVEFVFAAETLQGAEIPLA